MGTWGTAIFADDLAADVRADWRDAVMDGLSPEDATARLMERFAGSATDPDESPRYWMALAAAQAETGHLQASVRDRALAIIEAGADIEQFEPRDRHRRRRAVADLAQKLLGPQRHPVKLARPKPRASPVAVGDVVRVRGKQRSALFVVVALVDSWPPGSQQPLLAGLRLPGDGVPSITALRAAPLLRDRSMSSHHPDPVVTYHAVTGPSRGPRAFANHGEIVATGVVRDDAPAVNQTDGVASAEEGAAVLYGSWQLLAELVDGPWYEQMLSMTDAFEDRKVGGWRPFVRRFRPPRS